MPESAQEDLADIFRIEVPGHPPYQIGHSGDSEGTYKVQLVIPDENSSRLGKALGPHFVLIRNRSGRSPRDQPSNRIIIPVANVVLTMRSG